MQVGGEGNDPKHGKGSDGGGGGGVKPVALIIINKEDVRVEPILGRTASALGKIA